LKTARLVKNFRRPAVLPSRHFNVIQHGAKINCLAMVAAVIFAELLHAENFRQSCENAMKFYYRGRATSSRLMLLGQF
jgi:hypothetical protein